MELRRLLEMAGVADLPKSKKLIEAEKKQLPVYFVTNQKLEIIKPGRYQGSKGDYIYAYRNKQQAVDNAARVGRQSDLIIYELDQAEFPHEIDDRLATMYFVVPIRSYPT